jgi:hypothetical protein
MQAPVLQAGSVAGRGVADSGIEPPDDRFAMADGQKPMELLALIGALEANQLVERPLLPHANQLTTCWQAFAAYWVPARRIMPWRADSRCRAA